MNRKQSIVILTVVIGFIISHFASTSTVSAKVDASSTANLKVQAITDSVETDRDKRRVPRTASGSQNAENCNFGSATGLLSSSSILQPLTSPLFPFQSASGASQASNNCPRCNSSGISPTSCNDSVFVVDCGGGLDTGCTFRGGGPLNINLKVGRVVGDVAKLKASGAIKPTATLRMPAFDVDYFGGGGQYNPERDRISFNGRVVPGEFLKGDNNVWRLNEFEIPIEWINFPSDPGRGGTVTPANNIVRIDIDTANSEEVWCVSIDWVELKIEVARPVVMAHGILSSGSTWSSQWVPGLNQLGIPNTNELNMGRLDSIGNNSRKISNVVSASKTRWGVDRVNIVAHSKGGLDSREYVENNQSVEQLIQLGTPNAGSPLADRIQSILIRGGARFGVIGALAPVLIETFAAPAAIQLTTPYMRFYNATHGSNPRVRYTALAGNYNPNCPTFNIFCRPLDRALLAITGPGDTIVPVRSVHALPYTRNRIFNSSGGDGQAKHTSLTGSAGVFNRVKDRTTTFGTFASVDEPELPVIGQTSTIVESTRQGQQQTHTIAIDQSTPATISLMYPSGNLDMALISPSGQRFDAVTVIGNPNVGREEDAYLGGIMEVYQFASPEVGIWTVEITAPSVVESGGTVGYAISGWIENPTTTLTASLARSNVPVGGNLRVFGTLKNNNLPITGATVKAQIGLPDKSVTEIILTDDGTNGDATANDGIYTGNFADTTQPGNYGIAVFANGGSVGGTPAFSREEFALATVSQSTSTISGPFSDSGEDTDGDGLYNNLAIRTNVNATVAGNYLLYGLLTDSSGNTLTASLDTTLAVGSNPVTLRFDGESIFANRINGPYRLSVIRLAENGDLTIAIVDEINNAHQTAAYDYRQFQHTGIFLSGTGSAVGVDTNANGRFDLLNVDVGVEVRQSGYYQWSARLVDINGREIGFDSGAAYFDAGANAMKFSFDGRTIGRNGVDGPYFVKGLLIFGAGDSLIESDVFTTDAFSANQFEGFVNDSTPPTIEVSLSPDVLSPANHKMISITATINVQDNVDPNPTVELVSITANEPVNGKGDGNTESDIDDAEFNNDDRTFSLRAERSGNGRGRYYTVTYRATDAAGNTATASTQVFVPHNQ